MAYQLKYQKVFSNMTHRVEYTNVQNIPSNKLTSFYNILINTLFPWIVFLF